MRVKELCFDQLLAFCGLVTELLSILKISPKRVSLQTTAVALSWCLFALTNNPEVQERARNEIRDVLSSLGDDEDITVEHVDQMEYVAAVCKETLR